MKKTIVSLATIMTLISCGGSSEKPVSTDSVVVSTDSVAVADSSVGATQDVSSLSESALQANDDELGNPTKRKTDVDAHEAEIIK